jgi:hypothetical protein
VASDQQASEPIKRTARRRRNQPERAHVVATFGSGKSHLAALSKLLPEQQRFALILLNAVGEVAENAKISENEVRNVVYRVVQGGLLQEHKAHSVRRDLARALGPTLAEIDPVPHATVEQARRLAKLRASLLRQGAFPTSAIAKGREMNRDAARQWISRARNQNRLFTVAHDGETLVPSFLLDDKLEPRSQLQAPISALRKAGEDGWALWAWFASPSPWLGGETPGDLVESDPERVTEAARQRALSMA